MQRPRETFDSLGTHVYLDAMWSMTRTTSQAQLLRLSLAAKFTWISQFTLRPGSVALHLNILCFQIPREVIQYRLYSAYFSILIASLPSSSFITATLINPFDYNSLPFHGHREANVSRQVCHHPLERFWNIDPRYICLGPICGRRYQWATLSMVLSMMRLSDIACRILWACIFSTATTRLAPTRQLLKLMVAHI